MPAPTSNDAAIDSFANAVFAPRGVEVLEAYSSYGKIARRFESANQLAQYDMAGRPMRKMIQLKPNSVPGETFRYTWEGWGLISVIFQNADHKIGKCSASANSKNRAEKWTSTYPEWPLLDTWNWPAVGRAAYKEATERDEDDFEVI
ncbi:MAG TPA: hypothetical protein VK743_21290 [Steroidobacteraceae bacterium]|nr:hypothetical protein [Steroidobacteraceae bacterium]